MAKSHRWIPSTLGHGETMCADCHMTNREAWVLGDECKAPVKPPKNNNDNEETEARHV